MLLLHCWGFEVLDVQAVYDAIKDLTDPEDYRQSKSEFQFIPSAQSVCGDHFCFFLNEQNYNDIPLVLVWYD